MACPTNTPPSAKVIGVHSSVDRTCCVHVDVLAMVEMTSFSLHTSMRKARDSFEYGKDHEEVTPTIASRPGGMKSFVAEMISPFTACWQPDIANCVPQCGEDYQVNHYTSSKQNVPAVVSPSVDRTNRSSLQIPTSPIISRHSSKLATPVKEETKPKTSDVEKPHSNDVLCGRGGSSNRHLGNTHFRELVAANKKTYIGLTKKQKMMVARKIVEMIHSTDPPGRFLSKDMDSGRWYDIGLPRSLEKTSQALREKNSNDYQSDQGTEVSDVLSDMSPSYSPASPPDTVVLASPEPSDEKTSSGKTFRTSSKNPETPNVIIPPHLMHVFGPEKLRESQRVWADHTSSNNLDQPYLPPYQVPLGPGASSPLSPPSHDHFPPRPMPHHHYHGGPPPPTPHYHRYGGLHPATPPRPDYRDHYDYYPHPDGRDHYGQHSSHRAPPPISPSHYRAYPPPGPPSTVHPSRPYVQHGGPPVGPPGRAPPVHPMSPYHPHPHHHHHYDYQHGLYRGSTAAPPPQLPPPTSSSSPAVVVGPSPATATTTTTTGGYIRSKSEISPDRQQEWKRQRNDDKGTTTARKFGSDSSLSRAVQNSLTLEERVVGRERAAAASSSNLMNNNQNMHNPPNDHNPNNNTTTTTIPIQLVSPSGTLQGRSRPRGEENRGLSSLATATSLMTEKEGDAVTVLSGLAALSTAAFLKLDESE